MSKNFIVSVLVGACCLVFSQDSSAQVNTLAEVSYYEPTNSIRAVAVTWASYDTLAYYDLGHWGQVDKNDTALTMFWAGSYDGLDAYNEEFFPYDPEADYTIQANAQLVAKIQHNIGDTYEDYYNYVEWSYSEPALSYPGFFGFTGPGPDVEISGSTILLGSIYSIFTQGGTAGEPHHLKVDKDEIKEVQGGCGQKERLITYIVEDDQGRKAGNVAVGETFPSTIYSSCTGNAVQPTPCSFFYGGKSHPQLISSSKFTDHLRVGCPAATDECGFSTTPVEWVWCKRPDYSSQRKTIGRFDTDVRKRNISVNGRSTQWPKGTVMPTQ